jgi:hypothetical protein
MLISRPQGGSLFQFCHDGEDGNQPSFFALPQGNFGVRGGSQLWEDHIRPYIDAYLDNLGLSAERASVLRDKFLFTFFQNKNELNASVSLFSSTFLASLYQGVMIRSRG